MIHTNCWRLLKAANTQRSTTTKGHHFTNSGVEMRRSFLVVDMHPTT